MGHMTITTVLLSCFIINKLGLAIVNLSIKLEVSICTNCKDMKGNTKCRNGVVRGT